MILIDSGSSERRVLDNAKGAICSQDGHRHIGFLIALVTFTCRLAVEKLDITLTFRFIHLDLNLLQIVFDGLGLLLEPSSIDERVNLLIVIFQTLLDYLVDDLHLFPFLSAQTICFEAIKEDFAQLWTEAQDLVEALILTYLVPNTIGFVLGDLSDLHVFLCQVLQKVLA